MTTREEQERNNTWLGIGLIVVGIILAGGFCLLITAVGH